MPTRTRLFRAALAAVLVATGLATLTTASAAPTQKGPDDVVVVAIIDSGISPYHWDFLASHMPQARNRDKSDDLPLTKAPHTWLPGFPKPSSFASYNSLKLTYDGRNEEREQSELHAKDAKAWAGVKSSTATELNYYWLPGSKVIGAIAFEPEEPDDAAFYAAGSRVQNGDVGLGPFVPIYGSGGSEHGTGTSSVSVGNIYGSCPECLLVFLQHTDETNGNAAMNWAMKQPWIDVISNSYGYHTAGSSFTRDNVYGGADTKLQRSASDRGQSIFWSAGNGYENGYVIPNQTLLSSQKGPDWIITVGATMPGGSQYTGAGKPVDLAGIGERYPSAYGSNLMSDGSAFSGTSNATPTIAGTYGRALYLVRRRLAGRSRVQAGGVIATGRGTGCGKKRRNCELADNKLTARELRTRLLHGAVSTDKGLAPGGLAPQSRVSDEHWLSEGHGTYFVRQHQDDLEWQLEFNRLWQPLVGNAPAPVRSKEERDWMLVDSWCRQHIWGSWKGGYYVEGRDKLPALDPEGAPSRAAYQTGCNALLAPRPPEV